MAGTFKALILEEKDGKVTPSIQQVEEASLPEGDVTVAVDYSDLNFKDGMVIKGLGKLVRRYPHIPGIDFAGTVEQSAHPDFKAGDKVILTGWRVGEIHWGGYAEKARVKGDWLVSLPPAFDTRLAMAMGTAGFTAGMAINALIAQGATPDKGDLLVTGAAGGVGSVAVALGAKAGYRVVASSGRPETHDYLRDLGASEIIDRKELSEGPVRPLDSERWGGVVDNVGSTTLAKALSQMRYRGVVASCGLAAGPDLPAMVVPFLLRGVRLIGIDSAECPMEERRASWERLARDLQPDLIERMTSVEPMSALPQLADQILKGQVRGRIVIDVHS